MTKERLYYEMPDDDYRKMLDFFFESNVVIPKGENRHPYYEILHELAEDNTKIVESNRNGNIFSTDRNIPIGIGAKLIKLRIKPSEPTYEWQWIDVEHILDCNGNSSSFIRILNAGKFMTSEEANSMRCYGNVVNWEETKRIRK